MKCAGVDPSMSVRTKCEGGENDNVEENWMSNDQTLIQSENGDECELLLMGLTHAMHVLSLHCSLGFEHQHCIVEH